MGGEPAKTTTSSLPAEFILSRADGERLTGGAWHGATAQVTIIGAAVDSRRTYPGNLFVCIKGEHVDGHDFAATAVAAGAALVLASRPLALPVPVLVVADVVAALGQLASEFRRRYVGAVWIGITGSSGKTTVKELTAAACAPAAAARGGVVHATRGNHNNAIGVPLTILNMPKSVAFAVIEMGANYPGEIAALAAIAQPEIGVITTIGPAHLLGFGDLAGVARAKSELFAALPPTGAALIGVSGLEAMALAHGTTTEALLALVRARAQGRSLLEVGGIGCPIRGEATAEGVVLRTAAGEARIALIGEHNLANAALAFHAAQAAGIDGVVAVRGLATVEAMSGRLRRLRLGPHLILDDSYNANPGSMIAGLHALAAQPGTRLAVLGGMGELGPHAAAGHAQVGAEAARLGLALITVGDRARTIATGYRAAGGSAVNETADHAAAIAAIKLHFATGPCTVLIKASRSSGLEAVVAGLLASEPSPHHQRANGAPSPSRSN